MGSGSDCKWITTPPMPGIPSCTSLTKSPPGDAPSRDCAARRKPNATSSHGQVRRLCLGDEFGEPALRLPAGHCSKKEAVTSEFTGPFLRSNAQSSETFDPEFETVRTRGRTA